MFGQNQAIKHGVELLYDLRDLGKINLGTGVCDPNFCVLGLFTDDGSDHNIQHAAVQTARILTFLVAGVDKYTHVRVIPNHSYVSSAEWVMAALSWPLQTETVHVERAKGSPEVESFCIL